MARDYQEYLRSAEWEQLRVQVFKRDDWACRHCGGEATEVHHLTYARIFHEDLADLVSLCRACHEEEHDQENADEEIDEFLLDEADWRD